MPAYENTFRQLYLNQWTEQDTRWLRMDHWAQGSRPCPVSLAGRDCFAGLDLATTFDTTALVLLFPLEDGTFWCEPHFWIPEENAHQRELRDKVPYLTWARKGQGVTLTEGNVTDYERLRKDINALSEKYRIRSIGVDPYNATHLMNQLQGDGCNVVTFRQNYGSLSPAAKHLENLVVSGKLLHNSEPLTWQAGNVAIQTDGDNIKPSKKRSHERIDGIVSLCMALGLYDTATAPPPEQSWDIISI